MMPQLHSHRMQAVDCHSAVMSAFPFAGGLEKLAELAVHGVQRADVAGGAGQHQCALEARDHQCCEIARLAAGHPVADKAVGDQFLPSGERGMGSFDGRGGPVVRVAGLYGDGEHRATGPEVAVQQALTVETHGGVEHRHPGLGATEGGGDEVGSVIDCLAEQLGPTAGEVMVGRTRGAPLWASTSAMAVECAPRSRMSNAAEVTMRSRGLAIYV